MKVGLYSSYAFYVWWCVYTLVYIESDHRTDVAFKKQPD